MLSQAEEAKNITIVAREKEEMNLSYTQAKLKKTQAGENDIITAEDLKKDNGKIWRNKSWIYNRRRWNCNIRNSKK